MSNRVLMLKHLGRMPATSEEHEAAILLQEEEAERKHARRAQEQRELRSQSAIRVSKDDRYRTIISDALRHFEAHVGKPLPVEESDSRWKAWAESMQTKVREFKTCREVLHFAQSGIPFDHREPVKDDPVDLYLYDQLVHYEFPWLDDSFKKLSDNADSIPETLLFRDGRILSNIFFWHARSLLFCLSHIKGPKRILELGGGYGSIARLWLKNDICEPDRYVIADLPQSLFFSEVALRKEFGDIVGYFENGVDPGTKVLLVPISELEKFKDRSDLVINIGSLQEMSDAWVSHYMGWLDRYDADWFYSLNYMGQPLQIMAESRTLWAPRPSENWTARVIHPDVPLVKIICVGRNFVEMLFEKVRATGSVKDWSVLKGRALTRETYLDGLELFRRCPTQEDAAIFLDTVLRKHIDLPTMLLPKELLLIAKSVVASGRTEFASAAAAMEGMIGHLSA
mgnify:CR=1 FL=1